ncbi:hypothetical protein ACFLYU_00040 [Candidatus Dependentiae bacterium]
MKLSHKSITLFFCFVIAPSIFCMNKIDLRISKYIAIHKIVTLKDCQNPEFRKKWRLKFSPDGSYILLFALPSLNPDVQIEYIQAVNKEFRFRALTDLGLSFNLLGEGFAKLKLFDAQTGNKKIDMDKMYLFMCSHNGNYLAVKGKLVSLLERKSIPVIKKYNKNRLYFYEFNKACDYLAIFNYLYDKLQLFNLKTLKPMTHINNKIKDLKIEEYVLSDYGKYLAFRLRDENIHFVNLREGSKLDLIVPKVDIEKYKFSSPNSRYFGFITKDAFRLIDLEKKGEEILCIKRVFVFEFCNDSRHLWVRKNHPLFSDRVCKIYLFDIPRCKFVDDILECKADLVIDDYDCNNGPPCFSPNGKYFCFKKTYKENILSKKSRLLTKISLINLLTSKKEKLEITIVGSVRSKGNIFTTDEKFLLVCDQAGLNCLLDLDSYDCKSKRVKKIYNLNIKNVIDITFGPQQELSVIYEEKNLNGKITGIKAYSFDLPNKKSVFYRKRLRKNRAYSDLVIKTMYASKKAKERKRKLDILYKDYCQDEDQDDYVENTENEFGPNEFEPKKKRRKIGGF